MAHTRRLQVFSSFLALALLYSLPTYADTPKTAAVFPFELTIERQSFDELYGPEPTAQEKERLVKLDNKLNEMLKASGNFSRVDLSPFADEIKKASPIQDCNGCELDIAKKAGAQVAIVGIVRKSTNTLINITIFIKETDSAKLVNVGAVSIHENTDAGWLRGVRWIMRNRILKRSQK